MEELVALRQLIADTIPTPGHDGKLWLRHHKDGKGRLRDLDGAIDAVERCPFDCKMGMRYRDGKRMAKRACRLGKYHTVKMLLSGEMDPNMDGCRLARIAGRRGDHRMLIVLVRADADITPGIEEYRRAGNQPVPDDGFLFEMMRNGEPCDDAINLAAITDSQKILQLRDDHGLDDDSACAMEMMRMAMPSY